EGVLSEPSEDGGEPLLAVDPAGDVLVAWVAADGRVLSRYRTAHGSSFGATQVLGSGASEEGGDLALAFDDGGVGYAAFVVAGEVRATIRGLGSSGLWSPPSDLSGASSLADGVGLAAAGGGADLVFVAADPSGQRRVYAATYRPGG